MLQCMTCNAQFTLNQSLCYNVVEHNIGICCNLALYLARLSHIQPCAVFWRVDGRRS